MQRLCDWVEGRSIGVSYIYILHLHLKEPVKKGVTSNKLQQNGFQMEYILTIMDCQQKQKKHLIYQGIIFISKCQCILNKNEKMWITDRTTIICISSNYLNNNSNKDCLIIIIKIA